MRTLALALSCLCASCASAQRVVYSGTASVEIVRATDVPDLQVRIRLLPPPTLSIRQAYTFRDLPDFKLRIS